jgi:hypothetical protein
LLDKAGEVVAGRSSAVHFSGMKFEQKCKCKVEKKEMGYADLFGS